MTEWDKQQRGTFLTHTEEGSVKQNGGMKVCKDYKVIEKFYKVWT